MNLRERMLKMMKKEASLTKVALNVGDLVTTSDGKSGMVSEVLEDGNTVVVDVVVGLNGMNGEFEVMTEPQTFENNQLTATQTIIP